MSQFLEAAWIALAAIWANKLRSFLTVLGNIVAVTSIITVVSLIQGMNGYVTASIVTNVGADNFTIQRNPVVRSREDEERVRNNPRVTRADAVAIRRLSDRIGAVSAQGSAAARVSYQARALDSVSIQGVSGEYAKFSTFSVERGRLMTQVEVDSARPVATLGADTAEQLFKESEPLDKIIKVAGVHFRVIGISEKKGSVFGRSQDEFVVIPLGTFEKIFGNRTSLQILVKPLTPEAIDAAIDDATVAMRIQRRLRPSEPDNFGLFTSDTLLEVYRTATTGIFAVLIGVVALSLVVGGIVIMNIMLMVVSERTREIGLRKALGARRRDITWQILTESVTLSLCGGVVGSTLGASLALLISAVSPIPASVQPWSVAIGLGVTAGVGLFFGWYPAMRAARLDPIVALRQE